MLKPGSTKIITLTASGMQTFTKKEIEILAASFAILSDKFVVIAAAAHFALLHPKL